MQILSITGNNTSNNNTMVQYLSDALEEFPGPANQTRCFVHTVNLIAKSILKPFDVRKAKDIHKFNDVAQALANSAEGLDVEEDTEHAMNDDDEEEEEEEFNALSLEPIRSMLLKVHLRFIDPNPKLSADWLTDWQLRKIAFMLKNSTTILLPAWYKTISAHGLPPCMMPQDVSTQWNSMFDMLDFAIRYRAAIDTMAVVRDFDLRKYELVPAEWKIATELRDALKVSNPSCILIF